jgi:hypothetical protein
MVWLVWAGSQHLIVAHVIPPTPRRPKVRCGRRRVGDFYAPVQYSEPEVLHTNLVCHADQIPTDQTALEAQPLGVKTQITPALKMFQVRSW